MKWIRMHLLLFKFVVIDKCAALDLQQILPGTTSSAVQLPQVKHSLVSDFLLVHCNINGNSSSQRTWWFERNWHACLIKSVLISQLLWHECWKTRSFWFAKIHLFPVFQTFHCSVCIYREIFTKVSIFNFLLFLTFLV